MRSLVIGAALSALFVGPVAAQDCGNAYVRLLNPEACFGPGGTAADCPTDGPVDAECVFNRIDTTDPVTETSSAAPTSEDPDDKHNWHDKKDKIKNEVRDTLTF